MSASKPKSVLEIFLQPGEIYFGDEETRIRTLLGSCISITLWHPRLKIGGMCHYMLPNRGQLASENHALDGRYADEAIALLMKEIERSRTKPSEYEVKLFGGGTMFLPKAVRSERTLLSRNGARPGVAPRNVDAARTLLRTYGLILKTEQVGGNGRRYVIFDIWSGHVWVRQNKLDEAA